MRNALRAAACAAAALLTAAPAAAHITLESEEAPAGSTQKLVFRVGHGCDGAATIAIRVQIPDGVIAVKPQPKPGWELATVEGPYAQPVEYFGEMLTAGVQEVTWSGGELPDAWYDEFVLRGRLPGAVGTTVYFPVVQECATGVHRWIEIPAAGQDPESLEEPAPGLTLTE